MVQLLQDRIALTPLGESVRGDAERITAEILSAKQECLG